MPFIGRQYEIDELERLYAQKQSNLVVIYGRRRVGKSTLIEHMIKGKSYLHFEGLEKQDTRGQLKQIGVDVIKFIDDPLLKNVKFTDWTQVFDYFTNYFKGQKKKTILFLDEFQWLAANRTKLVSLIKSYWDRFWSKQNVMLVLCGSVSSYMIKQVINSKALYGRINWEYCLEPFAPNEIYDMLDKKRSTDEILLYTLVLGGIPKYLQEIDPNNSFVQNINKLLFTKGGVLVSEYERIFYSQFNEYRIYESIINKLIDFPKSLDELSMMLNMPSGGGLSRYLINLEKASFITSYIPFNKDLSSRLKKYKLTDEYLRFYFKYVKPNFKIILTNTDRNLFNQMVLPNWDSWLGYAFENFCIKNAIYLAKLMGFSDQVKHFGPLFHREGQGFQIDLIYDRLDKVITVCEIKYHSQPIGVSVVREVEKKCELVQVPRGYTLERVLISRYGADEALIELGYFNHIISQDDFFE